MPNTYHKLYVHAVFAVKYRRSLLNESFRPHLFKVMMKLINETGGHALAVNGVEDHAHCLFRFSPAMRLSDVVRNVKAKSSRWLNRTDYLASRFEWQTGSALFSVSEDHLQNLIKYVDNQKEHHSKNTFQEEYKALLEEYGIQYEEEYLFHDLQ